MAKCINTFDHMIAAVPVERIDELTAQMSWLFQTAFYTFDRQDAGVRVVISYDAGFEMVCPLSSGANANTSSGANWVSAFHGVRDIGQTEERLKALGIERSHGFNGVSGVEPYCERYERVEEVVYDPQVYTGLRMGYVQSDEHPDSRTAGPRTKNINRVDHVVAEVPLEGFQERLDKLGLVLQVAFYGPYDRADGRRVAASWDGRYVIEAPLDATDPVTPRWKRLAFGVRDLDQTLARLATRDITPLEVKDSLAGDEPWAERFAKYREATFDPAVFSGLDISFTEIEEHADQNNSLS